MEMDAVQTYGKAFPEGAQLMSPSVVLDQKYEMLHVPVKEIVQDSSTAKERIAERQKCVWDSFYKMEMHLRWRA